MLQSKDSNNLGEYYFSCSDTNMLLRTETAVAHRIGMSILGLPDNGRMILLSYCINTECSEDDNNLINVTPPFQTGISC